MDRLKLTSNKMLTFPALSETIKPGLQVDGYGKLVYGVTYKGHTYGVTYGENKIVEYLTYMTTTPCVDFWNAPPDFETFVQAVIWLKRNVHLFM